MKMKEYEVIHWPSSSVLELKDKPVFTLATTTIIENKQVHRRYSNQDNEIHGVIKTILTMANSNSRSYAVPLEIDLHMTYLAFDKYRTQVSEVVLDARDGFFRPAMIAVRLCDDLLKTIPRGHEFFHTLPTQIRRSTIKHRVHQSLNEFSHIRGLCVVFETDVDSPEYYFHRQHLVREAYSAGYGIFFFDMPKG
jgi:hypothetical protein